MEVGVLLGVLAVVAANAIAPRVRVAAPLLLVVIGVVVSVQPIVEVGAVEVEPHLILGFVLPLLLFAAAVSMPAVNFRRNFGMIAGLSVTLVVITSLTLGVVFSAVVPDVGFAAGVAVGAVLSPTDAVATSIVKRLGVAPRVVDVLDGEAMLNDASALVMLRTAIAAMGATTSISGAVGEFLVSIAVATAIGLVVGYLTMVVRKRIHQATVNTLLSFAVPLIAFEPAEHAGASGLVAVVAAGLVIGHVSPRFISPTHRANERINWHTIEMLLEGGLFLLMGLQLVPLLREARTDVPLAVGLSAVALLITLCVRAVYTFPLLKSLRARRQRYEAARDKLDAMKHEPTQAARAALDDHEQRTVDRIQSRVRRVLADANYERDTPLGLRDAALIVWAGMRGAITLAAAQTLPADFPHRSLVLLVAFFVATASLLIQGGTVAWVVRLLNFPSPDEEARSGEREHLLDELETVGKKLLNEPATAAAFGDGLVTLMSERLAQSRDTAALARNGELIDRIFDAQRSFILDARRGGVYSTEALAEALRRIDAMQIGLGITRRGRVVDEGE